MELWIFYVTAAILLPISLHYASGQQALYRDCECTCRIVDSEIASISADVQPDSGVEEAVINILEDGEPTEPVEGADDNEDDDAELGSGYDLGIDDVFPTLASSLSPSVREIEARSMLEKGDHSNAVGKAGLPGSKGVRGQKGEPGVQGSVGSKGEQGEYGFQGADGYPGTIGDKGAKGERGEAGMRGYPGSQGPQGYRGPEGPRGEPGIPGKRGIEGPQGSRGLPGPIGGRGPQGEPGTRGIDGRRGPPGSSGAGNIPGGKMAFVARLENHLGPTTVATNVLFSAVDINKGQGYDPSSGSFLATYSGVYVFHLQVMALADHVAWLTIQVNEEAVAFAWASGYTTGQEQMGTTMTIQELNVGDVVNVVVRANADPPNYLYAHYTLFSGYLLGGD